MRRKLPPYIVPLEGEDLTPTTEQWEAANGELIPRNLDWAERLTGEGFVVLFPGSFGPRRLESRCETRNKLQPKASRCRSRFIQAPITISIIRTCRSRRVLTSPIVPMAVAERMPAPILPRERMR